MILVFGASYGVVVATKLMLAGYDVTCVCKSGEATLINNNGFFIEIPGYLNKKLNISSQKLPGKILATTPENVNLDNTSLVFLAMQEAQYSDLSIKNLMINIAKKKIPSISIMNIPPSNYLKNFNLSNLNKIKALYKNYETWEKFDLNFLTHSSADPQVYKPDLKKTNYINVRLASNFKISNFKDSSSSNLLKKISANIKSSRLKIENTQIRIPINLNIYNSVYVPISKWPMLIAGNYRCIESSGLISIKEALFKNIEESRLIYNDVIKLCILIGAEEKNLINFETYLKAAKNLTAPSSVARAVHSGNQDFERVDKLILFIAEDKGMEIHKLKEIVKNFDQKSKLINK